MKRFWLVLPVCACDVRFGRQDALWLLWLVAALAVFLMFVFRRKRILLRRFAEEQILGRLMSQVSSTRARAKAVGVLLGLFLLVLALAELRYGFVWEEVTREGVDIVVALDVSDSMLVEDAESGAPLSRLSRAKRELTDLLRLLEGDRVALVAFAGAAFVECPLTLDYGAAEVFLRDISPDFIPVKGTAIGEAIRMALRAFDASQEESRAILLITDGEDHGGQALAAAEEAKTKGVRIFAIGIGRDEGAPIPDERGGFRKDQRGELVLSRLDETTLQKIALATGGTYVRSVTGDMDLEKLYAQGIKATLKAQELGSRRRQRWEERFQWVLALALLVLGLEPFIRERRGRTA